MGSGECGQRRRHLAAIQRPRSRTSGCTTGARFGSSRWTPQGSTSRSCRCSIRACRTRRTSRAPSTSPGAPTTTWPRRCARTPNRFGGFATLATQDPDAATAELERAVTELGLVGGLINGHCQGRYLDDPGVRAAVRVRRVVGCADLPAPHDAASRCHGGVVRAVRRRRNAPRLMGIRRRDRDARVAAHLLRVVRQVPAAADDHRPPRRDAAVRRLPDRSLLRARRRRRFEQRAAAVAVGVSAEQLPRHDERQLLPAVPSRARSR